MKDIWDRATLNCLPLSRGYTPVPEAPRPPFWEFCFELIIDSPAEFFADALDDEEEFVPQWLVDITDQWSKPIGRKMQCPPKFTLFYWTTTHTADEGLALREKEDLLEEDKICESVLCNERLALILVYSQREELFLDLYGSVRRAAEQLSERRGFSDSKIADVRNKIKNASDHESYCLQRELKCLLKLQQDAERYELRRISSNADVTEDDRYYYERENSQENQDFWSALAELDLLLDPFIRENDLLQWDVDEVFHDGSVIIGDHKEHGKEDSIYSTEDPRSFKRKCNVKAAWWAEMDYLRELDLWGY